MIKRLDRNLEIILSTFRGIIITIGYFILKSIITNNTLLDNQFSNIGKYIFITIFVIGLILLIIAEIIKIYIRNSENKIYYKLKWSLIVFIPLILISFLELFFTV